MSVSQFRPDLTEYRIYVEMLQDKLNEDSLSKMSMTDAVKIALEKVVSEYHPDVEIKRVRKVYQTLPF
jgi:hypothetical protein